MVILMIMMVLMIDDHDDYDAGGGDDTNSSNSNDDKTVSDIHANFVSGLGVLILQARWGETRTFKNLQSADPWYSPVALTNSD